MPTSGGCLTELKPAAGELHRPLLPEGAPLAPGEPLHGDLASPPIPSRPISMQQKPPIYRSLCALLALTAALVSGCRDTAAAGRRTVIEFWSGWSGHEARVFQALVDRFNREHRGLYV